MKYKWETKVNKLKNKKKKKKGKSGEANWHEIIRIKNL